MRSTARSFGRMVVAGALVAGLLSSLPATARAEGEGLPSIEVPGGNLLQIDRVTPFSMRVRWATSKFYKRFTVSISGGNQAARVFQAYSGPPRQTGKKNINRLEPDTTYRLVVKARAQGSWVLVGSATVKTEADGATPTRKLCGDVSIRVRSVTKSSAEIYLSSNCEIANFAITLMPVGGGAKITEEFYLFRPTTNFRYLAQGLDSQQRYRVLVHEIPGEETTLLGDPVLFRTP